MWSRNCIHRNLRSKNRTTFLTVVILGCFIFIVLLGYTAFGEQSDITTLKQVHIIFRHGDRSPLAFYKEDPYQNHTLWSAGVGELTNNGKHQMYEFGKTLRSRYKNYLPEMYRSEDTYVRSSYANRCQMSALTLLAGLYPPKGEQIWNPDLLWQPIPINSIPKENDNMLSAKADCPSLKKEHKAISDDLSKNLTEEFKDLYTYLTKHSGSDISDISEVERLYFILRVEEENNLHLPEWTKTVYPEPMRSIAKRYMESWTYNDKLKRLRGGPILSNIFDQMKKSVNGEKVEKFFLYSAHDVTIVSLLRTLGIIPTHLPEYGSAVILELHYSHLEHIVSAHYYRNCVSEPKAINIPNCGQPCVLEKLIRIRSHVIPTDWNRECNDV